MLKVHQRAGESTQLGMNGEVRSVSWRGDAQTLGAFI